MNITNLPADAGVLICGHGSRAKIAEQEFSLLASGLKQRYPSLNSFAISPGPVATDMIVNAPWYQQKNAFDRIPLRRFCQPKEIAHAAYCLASLPMIRSGENLILDGGYSQTTQTA